MGNTELKAAFKTALKDQQSKEKLGLTAEILLEDTLIQSVEEFIKQKMSLGEFEKDKAFPETNSQTNDNADDFIKREIIAEINENFTSGFATAESNIEALKEPSFEKYFTVSSPDTISDYTKLQQQKFVILYALFVEKYKEQQDKKQNFFDYVQRFLQKSDVNQRVQVGLESGFKFSLSLLREIKSINKDMLVNSLEYLYQTLRSAEPGSLYSTDKLSFMIDSNLNDARAFLVGIIEDKSGSQNPRAVELSFKIILLLGVSRSNVEDFLLVSTLLEKHNVSIDLRSELQSLKEEGDSQAVSGDLYLKRDLSIRKTTKSGSIFYLQAGDNKTEIKQRSGIATDGQSLYLHQEGLGLLKMSTGNQGSMVGQVFQHRKEYLSGETASLMCLNGKLYLRSQANLPKPFVRINTESLEEEKDDYELEKEEQNLEWKENEETGRSLTYTPIFTDGQFIYVVALKKSPKAEEGKEQEGGEEGEPKVNLAQLVVEIYDPSTPSYKLVRDVTLYKNEELEPFVKKGNDVEFLKDHSFVTNGQLLMIQSDSRSWFFDLKTGIRCQKTKNEKTDRRICYDFQNNVFLAVQWGTPQTVLESFTISNFKKGVAETGFAKEFLSKRISLLKTEIFGEDVPAEEGDVSHLNLIQRIMMDVSTPDLISASKSESKAQVQNPHLPQLTRTLILRHIEKACGRFDVSLEEIRSQGKSASEIEEFMMSYFKFPNATYLTNTLFQQIQEGLEKGKTLINQKKTSANLPDQYSFFFMLRILSANFQALQFCSISLPGLMKKQAYDRFLATYKDTIVKIIESGFSQDFEQGASSEEMKQLWGEIYRICGLILSSSINMLYTDTKDIIKTLEQSLKKIDDEKQAENSSISLNYLSVPENCKSLLKADQEELDLLRKVFERCCQIKSTDFNKQISSFKLGQPLVESKSSAIVSASNKFIKNISEQLITQYCSLIETISGKTQIANQSNAERDKKQVSQLEGLITFVLEHVSVEISHSLQTLVKSLEGALNERASANNWDGITEQYEKFASTIDNLFQFDSALCQIVTLYVQTFSIFNLKTNLLPSITQSVINIVGEVSQFFILINKYQEHLNLDESKDQLRKYLSNFSRTLSWFTGKTAYKLIKIKESGDAEKKEKKTQDEKMQELIIQSNLLSGGIENRFLSHFSQDSQNTLIDLTRISQDDQMLKLLKSKPSHTHDDEVLSALLNPKQNENVDRLITILQQLLERKVPMVPYARLAGPDGMRLSRATFAVMIKFSEHFTSFIELVDEVDMHWSTLEGVPDRDLKIKEEVKKSEFFEPISKRWESASKMRQWINEKKQNMMDKIKKTVEADFLVKKAKKVDPVAGAEVEQIDTSVKVEGEGAGLTESDKQAIEDICDAKFETEMQTIYTKVIEKADFLIKLQVPAVYLVNDHNKKKEGTLLFIAEPNRENTELNITPEFDWKDRLKQWRQMQTSKGAIKSFTDRKKEIFDSSVMSILACLQTPISYQRIKKQVESVFLNASKRVAGLKLLSQLMQLELPQAHRYDLMSWFSSSIRGNKNVFSHYLDDLKGCGTHLEDLARVSFFDILKGLVNQLKESTQEQEIKAILDNLKWKYLARDHGDLKKLDIFRVLHEGNGKADNKLKKAWGRPLKRKVINDQNEVKVTKHVIDVFEQVFLLTVGRIIKPDQGGDMKLKQRGTTVPGLEKAISMIDEKVSETLIAQSFSVIFSEFSRYISIMKQFKGVDWTIYVNMKNNQKKDEAQEESGDVNLLDEEESDETKASEAASAEEEVKENEDGDLDSKERAEAIKQLEERAQKEIKSISKLYSESFLKRLLRLVEIFTSIATLSPYPLSMVQRVASPLQLQILLNLLVLSSPRIKVIVIKVIQNLIKIAIPFEVFEETINLINRDTKSQAYEIYNNSVPNATFEGSKFLQFLYNYLLNVRHRMWTKSGIESEGQYAVTQEIITLFRTILDGGSQTEFKAAMVKKIKSVLSSKVDTWKIEESDVLLACIPAGGFTSLMTGSYALYKDTQKCIIVGFTTQIEQEQDLFTIDNNDLYKIGNTIYCKSPSKQRALVVFVGDSSFTPAPEIKAVDLSNLQAIATPVKSLSDSLLYDLDIIKNLISVLAIDVEDETAIETRQSQVQILKIIEFIVDEEIRQDGTSNFIAFLSANNLLVELFTYIQRNSSKPQIVNKNEFNLSVDLLEIQLSSLRANALESAQSLKSFSQLSAYISSYDTIAFFDQAVQKNKTQSFLKSMDVVSSINEDNLHPTQKKISYNVQLFSEIERDPSILSQHQELIIFSSDAFKNESEIPLLCKALQKAVVIIFDDKLEAEKLYFELKSLSKRFSFADPPHMKTTFLLSSIDLQSLREFRKGKSNEVVKVDTSLYNQERDLQFNTFLAQLKDYAGFKQEQLDQIAADKKDSADEGVKGVLSVKQALLGGQDHTQFTQQKSNINKLLVGKMAMLQRKQVSIRTVDTTVYNDIGLSLWEQTFSKQDLTALINTKFVELNDKPLTKDNTSTNRQQAYENALNVTQIKDKELEQKYTSILNKLLRLRSRSLIVNFLNAINPLPIDVINQLESLDKLILMAFNEGLNIAGLTGNYTLLNQVKLLIKRIIKEPQLKNFVNDLLVNQMIKPAQQVVKRMYEESGFMQKNVFDSEVDSQMYPNPQMVYYVVKLILNQYPEIFNNIRGLLPNSVSVLVSLALAFTSKDASSQKLPTKFAALAARLMSEVSRDPSLYPYIKDIANHTLLWKINEKLNAKISRSKTSEQSKILKEIYNDLTLISQWHTENTHTQIEFLPHQQQVKFAKKVRFTQTKDALTLLQISKDQGSVEQIREKVAELSKTIKSHPLGMRVPFISKMKSIENSEMIKLHFMDTQFLPSDHFKIYNDEQCEKRIGTTYLKNGEETQEIYKNQVYLSYTTSIGGPTLVYGWAKNGRCATNEQSDTTYYREGKAPNESYFKNELIQEIQSVKGLGMALHSDGYSYKTGYVKSQSTYDYFGSYLTDMKHISIGRNTYCIVQKNNDIHVCGAPKDRDFDQGTYYSENYYKQTSKPPELTATNNIISISSGSHFTVFCTEGGQLYGMGNKLLKELGMPEDGTIIKKIEIPENLKVLRVWASKAKGNYAAIIEVQEGSAKYLMSAGIHVDGLLGQGGDVIQSKTFKKLDYDHNVIKFTKVSLLTNHVLALTEDGQVYGWGSNELFRLGLDKEIQRVHQPTLLPAFANVYKFKVINVAAGDTHSFINVIENDMYGLKLGVRSYQLGFDEAEDEHTEHRLLTKEELVENAASHYVTRVKALDGLGYQIMTPGTKCTFFKSKDVPADDGESNFSRIIKNEVYKGIVKREYLHFFNNATIPAQQHILPPLQEVENGEEFQSFKKEIDSNRAQLIAELSKGDGWHFFEQKQLFQNINVFPGVSLAIRHPIEDFSQKLGYFKELLEQANALVQPGAEAYGYGHNHGVTCSDSNTEIQGKARYYASYEQNDQLKEVHLSEEAFATPVEFDHLPLVYFRISRPLKEGAVLPTVDLSKIFTVNPEKLFKFEIRTYTMKYWFSNKQILVDYLKSTTTSDAQKAAFLTIFRGKYNQAHEQQILKFYNECSYDQIPQDLDVQFFNSEKDILKYLDTKKPGDLNEQLKATVDEMKFLTRANFSSISTCLFIVLQFFKFGLKTVSRISQRSLKNLLQSSLPVLRRSVVLSLPPYMKRELLNTSIQSLPGGERISVSVKRRKAYAFTESGQCDHEGIHTIFGQIMQQLKAPEKLKAFYQNTADQMAFSVEFKGEGSIDAGGPYRETLTNLCNEMQSAALPLLIPTPNNKNNHGDNRECYMINPSNSSPTHLEMFKYFGYYIGFAIRSESALQLDLAPIFWRLIMEETVNATLQEKENDLKTFDTYSWQVIQDLKDHSKNLSAAEFDSAIDEYFVTHLSDGVQVELVPGGRNKKVTKENVDEFISLVIETRINESSKQIKSVLEGVNQVIPLSICRLLTWKQIEIRATGSKVLDVARLKRITEYSGGSQSDSHVQFFWQAIESFTDEERIMYLKFVWGRTRLPNQTDQKHKIVTMDYQENRCLPISHTCFFTLDLPRYPSFEIARAKILIAIVFCGDIDADRDQYSIGAEE